MSSEINANRRGSQGWQNSKKLKEAWSAHKNSSLQNKLNPSGNEKRKEREERKRTGKVRNFDAAETTLCILVSSRSQSNLHPLLPALNEYCIGPNKLFSAVPKQPIYGGNFLRFQ